MPQSGDSDLWPTNDDDKPRKSPSEPVKDAVTHQLPVPDQQQKPAAVGWFDPPKAEEPEPGRDESHARPAQQRTQPVSWQVAELAKQAPNQSEAATSFAKPVPTAPRSTTDEPTAFVSREASPAWPNGQDTGKGKEFTQSSQIESGEPAGPSDPKKKDEPTAETSEPDPAPTEPPPAEKEPENLDWFASPAPAQPESPADRETEHSAAADTGSPPEPADSPESTPEDTDDESAKGDTTVNIAQPPQAEDAEPAATEDDAATPAEDSDSEPEAVEAADDDRASDPVETAPESEDSDTPPSEREAADQAPAVAEEPDSEPAKGDTTFNLFQPAQPEPAEGADSTPPKVSSTVSLFPPPNQTPTDDADSKSTKSGNAANLFPPPPRETDSKPAKGDSTVSLSQPKPDEPADRTPEPAEDDKPAKGESTVFLFPVSQVEAADSTPTKSGNATNLFPPPQRETKEPPARPETPANEPGADSKTVFFRPVPPPRPPVTADSPPAFIRPRQQPPAPPSDPATVHIPRPEPQKEWPPPEPPRAAPQRVGPLPEEPPAPRKKKPLLVGAIALVAVLAVAAGVVFGVPGVAEKLGLGVDDVVTIDPPPAPVAYSPGLHGPDASAPAPSQQGVESVLSGPMSNPALGTATGVVIDPTTGETLYERGGGTAITPASTGKLLTAAAALLSLDHTQQLVTKVVQGDQPNEVIIVGGGDPTISSLEPGQESVFSGAPYLSDLVSQVKKHGVQITTVYIDQSRYAKPTMAPSWDPADINAGYIAPIVPAMLDGDRQDPTKNYSPRTTNPGGKLVDEFAAQLGATAPANAEKKAPADAKVLAEIRSAPVSQLVDNMLDHSENTLGDILAHEVAIKAGEEPSFAGASKAVLNVLSQNGFDVDGVVLRDGSGMSTENKVSAKVLAQILAIAAAPDGKDPRTGKLRPLLGGLPVAGGSGTLADRYDEGSATEGRGWVRAKTGSLTGVNSLAGIVLDKDNRPLVFAFLTTGTTAATARPALDTVSAALRGCGCQ